MAQPSISIRRLCEDANLAVRHREVLEQIFFVSSARQIFADQKERDDFLERWLGRYLRCDARWTYLAFGWDALIGYLAGAVEDPAQTERFKDVGYNREIADLTEKYPAHLHINVAPEARGMGVGAKLIEAFVSDLSRAGVSGVHLVTGEGSRNIGFYEQNGFRALRTVAWAGKRVVMLGRAIGE